MLGKIAARAIIIDGNKVLLVKHKGSSFWALPGGKMDEGETIKTVLEREIYEELGVHPKVGKLLCINEFYYANASYSLEFFFYVDNAHDFLDQLGGEHTELELEEIEWFDVTENLPIMPEFLKTKLPEYAKGNFGEVYYGSRGLNE